MAYATPLVGKDVECPICKKKFILYPETWVYKRRIKETATKYFCSWSCLQEFDQRHPKKIAVEQRDEIIRLIKQGMSLSEIVRSTGADRSKVRYWMDRTPKGEEGE